MQLLINTDREYPSIINITLKQARQKSGLSLVKIAKKIGISPTTYTDYEDNAIVPRTGIQIQLSKILGVPTKTLFDKKLVFTKRRELEDLCKRTARISRYQVVSKQNAENVRKKCQAVVNLEAEQFSGFTSKEKEILELFKQGLPSKQISEKSKAAPSLVSLTKKKAILVQANKLRKDLATLEKLEKTIRAGKSLRGIRIDPTILNNA